MQAGTRTTHAGTVRVLGALTVFAAAALFAPSTVSAQSPVSPGTLSVSFGLDSTPGAGIWFAATNHTRIGLLGTLDRVNRDVDGPGGESDTDTWTAYSAGPALKWYLSGSQQRFAPFWYLAGTGGVNDPPGDVRTTRFTADVGFGADWFVVPQMSLGGTTGLSWSRARTSEGDVTVTDSTLRSLTVGLQMHLYF